MNNFQKFRQHACNKIANRAGRLADKVRIRMLLGEAALAHASQIESFTSESELRVLLNLALACPPDANILEIGSYLGKSTCFLAAGIKAKGGKIYCVDTWQNETMPTGILNTMDTFMNNITPVAKSVICIRKLSSEIRKDDLDLPLDLVFIDGDHSYEAVRKDFEIISPWVHEDGIVAFHDSRDFRGVSRVIGEALATGRWQVRGAIDNILWICRAKWNNCWTQKGLESP
jgi:predicted O-methyltransferase YrrM